MIIFKKITDLQEYLREQRKSAMDIGFVPTMGALHKGHRSLIERAKSDNTLTVCSIFVNPTQFNDKNDYQTYPTSTEQDILMLLDAGCDVLFMPSQQEMYPEGYDSVTAYDFGYLDDILEGAHRPGHFKGVGQIVGRLLEIVQPQYLYMGQKDYQQCMVVKKLLQLLGMEDKVTLVICPIIREADGLAMSSRNRRLTEPQRALASILYQCLVSVQSKQQTDTFELTKKECLDLLNAKGFVPEYVALADANDLTLLEDYDPNRKMIVLIAAKIGDIRLIDNLILN